MSDAIEIFFDFASPYAYFSLDRLEALARRHGRTVTLRPILLWAVRKSFAMAPPMDDAPKGAYLIADMERSARFFGMPYRHPDAFPISTHLAARGYYELAAVAPTKARSFVQSVFEAYFVENRDISDEAVLADAGSRLGLNPRILAAMTAGDEARAALVAANDEAAARSVWGSPFVFADGEAFFGADRLPQIEWHLAAGAHKRSPVLTGADNGI